MCSLAKDVDPVLVVVKPLPQLSHVDVDSEPLKALTGHTWQLGVVAKSRRQPAPSPTGWLYCVISTRDQPLRI